MLANPEIFWSTASATCTDLSFYKHVHAQNLKSTQSTQHMHTLENLSTLKGCFWKPFKCHSVIEAADILATSNFLGTSNVSQQIGRMGNNVTHCPCITPKAALYNFREQRPFTGIDKMVFQAFPVARMKLDHLTEEESSQHPDVSVM